MESDNLKNKIIKLRKEGNPYDEIKKILGCAKSTISYHCKNSGLTPQAIFDGKNVEGDWVEINKFYQTHTQKETSEYYNVSVNVIKKKCKKDKTSTEYVQYLNGRNKLTEVERRRRNVVYVQNRRRKIKEMSVEYKGGKCEKCGYNKCNRALEFHHLNPTDKKFSISHKGYTRSWSKVKKELDKCIMVCANCHAEIHNEIEINK